MNIHGWFHLGLTGLISLLSKGLSWVFSSTVRKHQFFGTQPSLWGNGYWRSIHLGNGDKEHRGKEVYSLSLRSQPSCQRCQNSSRTSQGCIGYHHDRHPHGSAPYASLTVILITFIITFYLLVCFLHSTGKKNTVPVLCVTVAFILTNARHLVNSGWMDGWVVECRDDG